MQKMLVRVGERVKRNQRMALWEARAVLPVLTCITPCVILTASGWCKAM